MKIRVWLRNGNAAPSNGRTNKDIGEVMVSTNGWLYAFLIVVIVLSNSNAVNAQKDHASEKWQTIQLPFGFF